MAASAPVRRRSFREIFEVPIILAVITVAGLLSALLGDGIWNVLSWFALSIPLAVIVFCASRPSRRVVVGTDPTGLRRRVAQTLNLESRN
jgi:hypothetical protein